MQNGYHISKSKEECDYKLLNMADDSEESSDSKQLLSTDPNIFTINVFEKRVQISKPLIPLKLVLFMHYGAGSFLAQFVFVLYKERGITLSEMSAMTLSAPLFQFIGTGLSGIIADKIGKSKPVYTVNVLITMLCVLAIILMPNVNTTFITLKCPHNEVEMWTTCGTIKDTIDVESCHGYCLSEFTDQCLAEKINCRDIEFSKELNTSFTIHLNNTSIQRVKDLCLYNVTSLTRGNSPYAWSSNKFCGITCTVHPGIELEDGFNNLLLVYGSIYVLFITAFSNSYRCLDATVMFLVEEYNSSFGHERCFAMLGNILVSLLAGYVSYNTAEPGRDRNYCSALYMYIALCGVTFAFLSKLQMRGRPPEKEIWQKVSILLKRLDSWVFFSTLVVLGTAYNLGRSFVFWYLEGMRASSFLLGLIISISSVYGLPFLWFSKSIVGKIGPTHIFLLSFLAHTVNTLGYSLITNPWYSLVLEGTWIFSYYLLWVAAVQYSHDIAPEGLAATTIAMAGAIHYSVGKVPAGLIGIYIMHPYGGRVAFRFSAIMTLIAAVLYGSYLYIKNKCCNDEKVKPSGKTVLLQFIRAHSE